MIESQEPTSSGVKIEVPEITDSENPYLETPYMSSLVQVDISDLISVLLPVIFPGGGGVEGGGGESGGGGASGDWFSTPISGDGMLPEIASWNGWVGEWTVRDTYPFRQIGRSRFLGNVTMERRGGEASAVELISARRGQDEPLKRYTLEGYSDHSAYNQTVYVFDGAYFPRANTLPVEYPNFDPYAHDSRDCEIGEYTVDCWQYCLSHNFWRCSEGAWIEQRAENGDYALPDIVSITETIDHRNIVQHFRFAGNGEWQLPDRLNPQIYTSYDIYENGIYRESVLSDCIYTNLPSDAYAENGEYRNFWERQHYPKIGNEVFQLNYRPSPLPVILGGSLPSYLILIVIVLLCAVSNNSVTSSIDSSIDEEKKRRKKNANG